MIVYGREKIKEVRDMSDMLFVCANDLIKRANEEKITLNRTKLQKLMYFLFGHYIAKMGVPLFNASFQAWQYGPVVPELYEQTKTKEVINYIIDDDGLYYTTKVDTSYGQKYFEIFDHVWDKYKYFSAATLSKFSHAKNSPWDIAYSDMPYSEINIEHIRKYFRGERIDA